MLRDHGFLTLRTDLIQMDRWAAWIDGVEEAIGPLCFLERAIEFVVFAIIVLTVRDRHQHTPGTRIGGFAQIACGLSNGIEKGCRSLSWADIHYPADSAFDGYYSRLLQLRL